MNEDDGELYYNDYRWAHPTTVASNTVMSSGFPPETEHQI